MELFTTDNIPEDVLIGKGNLFILEVHNVGVFQFIKNNLNMFHLVHNGRMYIKCGINTLAYIEAKYNI